MKKQVIITLKAAQTTPDMKTNKMELVTEGSFYKKESTYYITYKESEVTGLEGTTTTLKVAHNIVTLIRFGTVNSQFIFEQGQKSMSYYDTPNGAFTLVIYASKVGIKINDDGGSVKVNYSVEIDDGKLGENEFILEVKETGLTTQE